MLASSTEECEARDPWVTRMTSLPATVVSTTLEGPRGCPNATVVSGDAVDVVARLKEVPLRSHGSLSLNRALMAAGLVDRIQVTLFPVIGGQTGLDPIFQSAADFDLELVASRTFDGHIQELIYRPALRCSGRIVPTARRAARRRPTRCQCSRERAELRNRAVFAGGLQARVLLRWIEPACGDRCTQTHRATSLRPHRRSWDALRLMGPVVQFDRTELGVQHDPSR